ncbi:hypothetical protein Barb4_05151 [Bacteroidales bacterium Barb4]|nr:hypothetical protein Barb4_05151 [Bacteroidales bacterium Barb4]
MPSTLKNSGESGFITSSDAAMTARSSWENDGEQSRTAYSKPRVSMSFIRNSKALGLWSSSVSDHFFRLPPMAITGSMKKFSASAWITFSASTCPDRTSAMS